MKMKTISRIALLVVFFVISVLLFDQVQPVEQKKDSLQSGQVQPQAKETDKKEKEKAANIRFWITIIVALIVGFVGREGIRALFKYIRRKKRRFSTIRTAKSRYCSLLREKLGHIEMFGAPAIESKAVKLEDAFVSLRITRDWKCDHRYGPQENIETLEMGRHLTPEEVMKRTFQDCRLLLVIGDPGSGKTTLLKYYAVSCLNKRHRRLGFKRKVLPLYFPLRELEFSKGKNEEEEKIEPVTLPNSLAAWSGRHMVDIPVKQFQDWLQNRCGIY